MHSEGIMAGELKHGPLALIDETMPVLMIVMRDPVYTKCMNALQQVQFQVYLFICFKCEGSFISSRYLSRISKASQVK